MDIKSLITEISTFLTDTFDEIDEWLDKDSELRGYKPSEGNWTINQILEHIALTNHFLLILIEKGTRKALQNADPLAIAKELAHYQFHWDQLAQVGMHQSFTWIRPEHMEPKGDRTLTDIRLQLKYQVKKCLDCLDQLKNGEGVLYKTTMTVNDLGKLDVYEYIYFLAQHGKRHITQMQKNEMAFEGKE